MGIVAVAVVAIALAFIVLVAIMIPTLLEVRKAAVAFRTYMTDMDSQMKPVLKELRELTANLRLFTDGVVTHTDEVTSFMTALGDAGRNIGRVNSLCGGLAGLFERSTLWTTGAVAAGQYIVGRILRKRG